MRHLPVAATQAVAGRAAMEWIAMIVAGLVLVVITAPLAMLLLAFFVLVPLAHLAPRPAMLARATFQCPVSKTAVNVTFLTSERDEELDVVACSCSAAAR
jgi:hypothetical protein